MAAPNLRAFVITPIPKVGIFLREVATPASR